MFGYVERETLLHRLDPRTKIAWLLVVLALAILLHHPEVLLLLFLLTLAPVLAAGIPRHQIRVFLSIYILIFSGAALSQAMFFIPPGELTTEPLLWIVSPDMAVLGAVTGGIPVTPEGAVYGFIQGFRILAMLNASALLIMTTPMNHLFSGLRELGIPYPFIFMITTAVRFVPTLLDEYKLIISALRTRGMGRNPVRLAEYSLTPLIVNSVRRCNQLALAAESRAFSPESERSSYTVISFQQGDRWFAAVMGLSSLTLLGYGVMV